MSVLQTAYRARYEKFLSLHRDRVEQVCKALEGLSYSDAEFLLNMVNHVLNQSKDDHRVTLPLDFEKFRPTF